MIEKKISGRLGNQMFQYAALRAYMLKYGETNIRLNFDAVKINNFENNLKNFKTYHYEENDYIELLLKQKIIIRIVTILERVISKIYKGNRKKYQMLKEFEKKFGNILMRNGIFLCSYEYINFDDSKEKYKYFSGLLESPKYFDEYRNIILKEFTPKHNRLKKNADLYKKIEKSESVCISIRRGDFLSSENIKAHYVCKEDYFYNAINKIREMIPNAKFFVFSDDIEWCKKNMKFPKGTEFEDGTDPVWEKLRLMYSCKHFIISNSTFSWWAQYLSRNKKKVVIAPSRWKNTFTNEDIYQDNWTLIEV